MDILVKFQAKFETALDWESFFQRGGNHWSGIIGLGMSFNGRSRREESRETIILNIFTRICNGLAADSHQEILHSDRVRESSPYTALNSIFCCGGKSHQRLQILAERGGFVCMVLYAQYVWYTVILYVSMVQYYMYVWYTVIHMYAWYSVIGMHGTVLYVCMVHYYMYAYNQPLD
jgi:hypothetical protein